MFQKSGGGSRPFPWTLESAQSLRRDERCRNRLHGRRQGCALAVGTTSPRLWWGVFSPFFWLMMVRFHCRSGDIVEIYRSISSPRVEGDGEKWNDILSILCKLRCKQRLSRGWEGKRRIATDSVEGRCSVLLRQTDRHGRPVGARVGNRHRNRPASCASCSA